MITDYYCRGVMAKVLTNTPMSNALNGLTVNIQSQLPSGSSERLDFLGMIQPVREWIGPREAITPVEYDYTIRNRKWEDTINLPLEWINNDKTGNVNSSIAALGGRLMQWKAKLICDMLNNSTNTTSVYGACFDNLSFFNSAHVFGNGGVTYTNNNAFLTGAGPAKMTAYEAAKSIIQALQQLMSQVDDRGEPVNEDTTAINILVPISTTSQMASVFFQAINLPKLDTGSGSVDNPVLGWKSVIPNMNLIATPRLTLNVSGSTASMILLKGDSNACPLIYQENLGERKITMKGAGSDYEHDQDSWQYGVRLVGNVGYGRPWEAVQMTYT